MKSSSFFSHLYHNMGQPISIFASWLVIMRLITNNTWTIELDIEATLDKLQKAWKDDLQKPKGRYSMKPQRSWSKSETTIICVNWWHTVYRKNKKDDLPETKMCSSERIIRKNVLSLHGIMTNIPKRRPLWKEGKRNQKNFFYYDKKKKQQCKQ